MLQVRQAVHDDLDGNGDLLLDFFGGVAGPLRDDLDVVVGDVGIGFHRQVVERDRAPNQQQQRDRQHQKTIIERVIDECADHCSTVFCRTSALATTCWPGWMPETISCMLPGSMMPPITSTRWNF